MSSCYKSLKYMSLLWLLTFHTKLSSSFHSQGCGTWLACSPSCVVQVIGKLHFSGLSWAIWKFNPSLAFLGERLHCWNAEIFLPDGDVMLVVGNSAVCPLSWLPAGGCTCSDVFTWVFSYDWLSNNWAFPTLLPCSGLRWVSPVTFASGNSSVCQVISESNIVRSEGVSAVWKFNPSGSDTRSLSRSSLGNNLWEWHITDGFFFRKALSELLVQLVCWDSTQDENSFHLDL